MNGKFLISVNASKFFCSGILHTDEEGNNYFEFHHINEEDKVYLIRYVKIFEQRNELYLDYLDKQLKIVDFDKNKIILMEGSEKFSIEKIDNNSNVLMPKVDLPFSDDY